MQGFLVCLFFSFFCLYVCFFGGFLKGQLIYWEIGWKHAGYFEPASWGKSYFKNIETKGCSDTVNLIVQSPAPNWIPARCATPASKTNSLSICFSVPHYKNFGIIWNFKSTLFIACSSLKQNTGHLRLKEARSVLVHIFSAWSAALKQEGMAENLAEESGLTQGPEKPREKRGAQTGEIALQLTSL